MDLKAKIAIGIVYTLAVLAIGRYTVTSKPDIQVSEKQQTQKTEDKHIETKKTITETKRPDGTSTTVTVIDQTVQDDKKDKTVTEIQEKLTNMNRPLNISILAGDNYSQSFKPVYGLSVTKQVLGPFTIGAFGFQNKTIGLSIGVNF